MSNEPGRHNRGKIILWSRGESLKGKPFTVTLTGEEWAHVLAAADYAATDWIAEGSALQENFIRIHDDCVRQINLQADMTPSRSWVCAKCEVVSYVGPEPPRYCPACGSVLGFIPLDEPETGVTH